MTRERPMNPPILPRLLLVEDDPVSRAFLSAACEALPAVVDAADSVAAALTLASTHQHALWLIDANLPDGSGAELLRRLRASDPATPALAHTASSDRGELDALIAAGFAEVLVKPLSATSLQANLRRALGLVAETKSITVEPCGKLPLWDDAAALSALNGQHAHVAALRALFLDELPRSRDTVRSAAARGDIDGVRADLHRLRASCGFVGAARLGAIVHGFENQPLSTAALQRFEEVVEDLLASV